jgi:hypothetical protein
MERIPSFFKKMLGNARLHLYGNKGAMTHCFWLGESRMTQAVTAHVAEILLKVCLNTSAGGELGVTAVDETLTGANSDLALARRANECPELSDRLFVNLTYPTFRKIEGGANLSESHSFEIVQ